MIAVVRARPISLLLVSLFFVLASCNSPRKQIVGKWRFEGSARETVWEFRGNGGVDMAGAPGRYTFGDGNRLKIQTGAATFIYQLEMHGDRMTWKETSGTITELTRVK